MQVTLIQYSTLIVILLCVGLSAGIVWRVEQRLDISFKFLLAGMIVFAFTLIIELLTESFQIPVFEFRPLRFYLRFLITICFLFGLWEMRQLIRALDGEKLRKSKRKN